MARLGRGRRIKAAILRGRSVTTPTPLVRKRLVQTPVANDRAGVLTRVWRRKRAHIVVRARSVPTPTPLVRKRLLQTPNGNDRAFTVARIWRRKRAHIILRAPQPGPGVPKPKQPLASRAGLRASIRARLFQPRGAHLNRNVSVPTPTPLVRKRLVLSPNANERARLRASWLKPRPRRILRPPAPVALQPAPPRKPVIVMSRRAALRARVLRDKPRILRAPLWPQRPRPATVKTGHRAVKAARLRRARPRILRAPIWSPRPRPPIVSSNAERVPRLKNRRAHTTIIRQRVAPPPVPVVRHTPVVSRQRRDRVVRAYYQRHRAHFETSTLGSASAPVVIVIGQFDAAQASGGDDAGAATASRFDTANPVGGDDAAPALGSSFDAGQPGVTA